MHLKNVRQIAENRFEFDSPEEESIWKLLAPAQRSIVILANMLRVLEEINNEREGS